MRAPFILSEQGDILIFESLDSLERYVESPDIDRYLAFDADGQELKLIAPTISSPARWMRLVRVTRVSVSATGNQKAKELQSLLQDFLRKRGRKPSNSLPIPLLIDAALAVVASPVNKVLG